MITWSAVETAAGTPLRAPAPGRSGGRCRGAPGPRHVEQAISVFDLEDPRERAPGVWAVDHLAQWMGGVAVAGEGEPLPQQHPSHRNLPVETASWWRHQDEHGAVVVQEPLRDSRKYP